MRCFSDMSPLDKLRKDYGDLKAFYDAVEEVHRPNRSDFEKSLTHAERTYSINIMLEFPNHDFFAINCF